ncbi:hypothetical protein D3M59_09470 [Sphingomonas edaphi]|uniref:Uncharacterized protein n=1 Tax=Sphingomonas edaphi TaxID=2315689 RepID=A0A418PYY0_9SPHN|nr:hypothetical protein D3M59_09470 [Sphingomonas edaphi]
MSSRICKPCGRLWATSDLVAGAIAAVAEVDPGQHLPGPNFGIVRGRWPRPNDQTLARYWFVLS